MRTQLLKMSLAVLFSWFLIGQGNAQRGNFRMTDSIPGITKEQKISIATIHETQRIEMGELRDKKRSATTWDEKDKIERQMLEKRIEHRNSIRNVLNDNQKKYFDENYANRLGKEKGHFDKKKGFKNKQCKRMHSGNSDK